MNTVPKQKLYGWFSAKMINTQKLFAQEEKRRGIPNTPYNAQVYMNTLGQEVVVTCISNNPTPSFIAFDDIVFVGELAKYVKNITWVPPEKSNTVEVPIEHMKMYKTDDD